VGTLLVLHHHIHAPRIPAGGTVQLAQIPVSVALVLETDQLDEFLQLVEPVSFLYRSYISSFDI